MAQIVEGGVTTVEQQTGYNLGPEGGQVVYRYVGTRSGIDALVVSLGLASGRIPATVTPNDDGTATLDITYATGPGGEITVTDDPLSTEYSFNTPSAMVPLTEHPLFLADYQALIDEPGYGATFAKEYDQYYAGDIRTADISEELSIAIAPESFSEWLGIAYDYKQKGITSYYRAEPVLTVIDRYQGSAEFAIDVAEVNEVWTLSALQTALAARINPMPSADRAKLKAGEYLCESIERNAASDGSRVVTQSFRWAPEWDGNIYPDRHT